jgi:uncharacterized phage infection (PIP) family protein YhgE
MLGGTTAAIRAIAALIIVAICAAGLWYVTGLRADLAVSEENSKKLTDAIDQQKAAIEQIQQDQATIRAINNQLNSTVTQQNQEVSDLQRRFTQNAAGEKRDFGAVAAERPEDVQKSINRASDLVFRCLELATGAAHTPEELAAATPGAINRECPSLANPNYRQETTR